MLYLDNSQRVWLPGCPSHVIITHIHSFIIRLPKAFANTIDREHQSWVKLSWLLPSTYSHTGRTGGDHQDALVLRGWRLSSSRTWNPVTSPWMKQLMWLRIIPSGDWCLRLALGTPVGACQNRRSFNMFLTARHHCNVFYASVEQMLNLTVTDLHNVNVNYWLYL